MQVKQNKKFTAKYILGLFLSTTMVSLGVATIAADVYAAESEQKVEADKSLGITLRTFYNDYYKESPTFAFQAVAETVVKASDSQAIPMYTAMPLDEKYKNLAHFQHELSKVLGTDGNVIVNKVLKTALDLSLGDHVRPYADKTKPANEILVDEIARYKKALTVFSAQQNEAFKEVVSIIMSSLPPKDVIAELTIASEGAQEKDVKVIKDKGKSVAQMFLAYQLLKGQQTYVSAFMHFLNENLKSLESLSAQHKSEFVSLQEKIKNENIKEGQAHTVSVEELTKQINANDKQIALLTSSAQQGAASNNLSGLKGRKAELAKNQEKLEADYKNFQAAQILQESTLLDGQKKSVYSKVEAFLIEENKLYANFKLAFAALGGTWGYKTFTTYGVRGSRETLAVWGELDIAVHKMNKQLADQEAFFHRAFINALDKFKYEKLGVGKESQPTAVVEYTAEDIMETYGADLPTIKTAILEMFSIPSDLSTTVHEEAQAERQRLINAAHQEQKVQETLTAVHNDIQGGEIKGLLAPIVIEQYAKSPEDLLKENIAKVVSITSASTNQVVTASSENEAQKKSLLEIITVSEAPTNSAAPEKTGDTKVVLDVVSTNSSSCEIAEPSKVSDLAPRELLRPEVTPSPKPNIKEIELYNSFRADGGGSDTTQSTTSRYSHLASDASKGSYVPSYKSEASSSRDARLTTRSSYSTTDTADQKKNQLSSPKSDLDKDQTRSYTRGDSCYVRNRSGDSSSSISSSTTRRTPAPTYSARSSTSYGSSISYRTKGTY